MGRKKRTCHLSISSWNGSHPFLVLVGGSIDNPAKYAKVYTIGSTCSNTRGINSISSDVNHESNGTKAAQGERLTDIGVEFRWQDLIWHGWDWEGRGSGYAIDLSRQELLCHDKSQLLLLMPGQITRYPLPVSEPELPNPRYPILNLDSDFDYPKLVWVIRVISLGTRITQIFVYIFVFIMCCQLNIRTYQFIRT